MISFFSKNKEIKNGKKIKSASFGGISFYSEEKTYFEKKICFLGITIRLRRNRLKNSHIEKLFDNITNFIDCFKDTCSKNYKDILLWVDLSLGGGTESYSREQFKSLKTDFNIFRIQYDHEYDCYLISIPGECIVVVDSFDAICTILSKISFNQICVNSVVGWKKALKLLNELSIYKSIHINTKISYRCHDYYALCPSLNLLNCDGLYCNLGVVSDCQKCINKVHLNSINKDNEILFSEFSDIHKWREFWGNFLYNTVDEIIAFSNSTRELFVRVYPNIKEKIKIIPHDFIKLNKAVIKEHSGINIAFLGNLNLYQKGHDVVISMIRNNKNSGVKFFVIGSLDDCPNDVTVSGAYTVQQIPQLFEKYLIDIVFIPSICPETFSYTTAEAVSTGVPVACYNIGAPAERVSGYNKGLVLNTISAVDNLSEIIQFVKESKKLDANNTNE